MKITIKKIFFLLREFRGQGYKVLSVLRGSCGSSNSEFCDFMMKLLLWDKGNGSCLLLFYLFFQIYFIEG